MKRFDHLVWDASLNFFPECPIRRAEPESGRYATMAEVYIVNDLQYQGGENLTLDLEEECMYIDRLEDE